MTTEEFIAKAKNKQGNKYDYSNSVYTRWSDKVAIQCSEHGVFWQRPSDHLAGSGCKKCGIVSTALKKTGAPSKNRSTSAEFVGKAIKKHSGKYTYDNAVYITNKDKLRITCPIHGEFMQTPNEHLSGYGCSECAKAATREKLVSSTEVFVSKAINVHGDKYDYSTVQYSGAKCKVTIVCPHHGAFEQTPNDHLNGCGCRHCRTEMIGWEDSKWREQALHSAGFTGYKLYVVKVWDSEESFIKVGKTFVNIEKRFKDISSYYSYKVLHTIEADADTVSKLERKYQRVNKDNKYTPNIKFAGYTECFSSVIIEGKEYR